MKQKKVLKIPHIVKPTVVTSLIAIYSKSKIVKITNYFNFTQIMFFNISEINSSILICWVIIESRTILGLTTHSSNHWCNFGIYQV